MSPQVGTTDLEIVGSGPNLAPRHVPDPSRHRAIASAHSQREEVRSPGQTNPRRRHAGTVISRDALADPAGFDDFLDAVSHLRITAGDR